MLNNTLFFKQSEIHTISSYANRINDEVKSGDIGYYHLIDTSLNLIDESLAFIKDKEHIKNIVLVGMGGSSCGVKALRDMLFNEKSNQRELFILDNTSSHSFNKTLEKIKLEESLFLIISKTGSTIEVVSLFKLLIEHFKLDMQELKKYFVFITDKDSKLHQEGENLDIKCFFIPANVGGRFSILSAVGI
ncbi:TPA: glucose-6-phosphate isomerase, partial [Campylobacter jejuni]|nr:glucose-6-phosphate isomerase [Campylobacter jejuni]